MALRLAVVSDSVAPWNTGGKETRHHELLTRLARRGVQVEIYTMHWWDGPRRIERDGLTYIALCRHVPLYVGERRSIRQALIFALATLGMLWRRYDVVEVDAIPFLPLYPMRLVTWLQRRPMVVTWHEYWGAAYWTEYLGARGRLAGAVESISLRLPDRIVAASQGTGDRLLAAGPPGLDVRIVPNGVEAHGVRPPPSALAPVPPLVAAGRLLRHKQMDQAIEAVAELRRRGRPRGLLVIGEGPEEGALRRRAAELGLDGSGEPDGPDGPDGPAAWVRFSPFVDSHADLLDVVAAAGVLVFPSQREGFGMMALEAMSVGTPVVTSDHDDNFARRLVEPGVNGAWCDATPGSLADGIEACLADRPRLSEAARATAEDYDWDRLAERIEAAYRTVRGGGRKHNLPD